jgi:hypothetical protein
MTPPSMPPNCHLFAVVFVTFFVNVAAHQHSGRDRSRHHQQLQREFGRSYNCYVGTADKWALEEVPAPLPR